jgi:hypothetical protein
MPRPDSLMNRLGLEVLAMMLRRVTERKQRHWTGDVCLAALLRTPKHVSNENKA